MSKTRDLNPALTSVRRANLRGSLLCLRTDDLLELEWRGEIQWVDGGGTSPGGYWAVRRSAAVHSVEPGAEVKHT